MIIIIIIVVLFILLPCPCIAIILNNYMYINSTMNVHDGANLCSLRLYSLCCINNKHHQIYNLGTYTVYKWYSISTKQNNTKNLTEIEHTLPLRRQVPLLHFRIRNKFILIKVAFKIPSSF